MFTYPVWGAGGPNTALKSELVAWYDYSEASGTRYDSHGSNDLTLVFNTINQTPGVSADYGLYTQQYAGISRATAGELSWGAKDSTICVWLKSSSLSPTYAHAFNVNNGGVSAGNNSVGVGINNTDEWRVWYGSGSSWVAAVAPGTISTGTWYFIHAYYDYTNDVVGIQINNGSHTTTTSAGTPNYEPTGGAVVGYQFGYASNSYDGSLDSQGHWNRLLTTDEVAWLYNSGNGRQYSEL